MGDPLYDRLLERIQSLEAELAKTEAQLSADQSSIPEDVRKAIRYDILRDVKTYTRQTVIVAAAIVTAVLSIIGFVGLDALARRAPLDRIATAISRVEDAEKQIEDLQMDLSRSKEAFLEIQQTTIETESRTDAILQALPTEWREEINQAVVFGEIESWGVTPEVVAHALQASGFSLEPEGVDPEYLRRAVSEAQSEHGLEPDGRIGPATAALFAAISIKANPEGSDRVLGGMRTTYRESRLGHGMSYYDFYRLGEIALSDQHPLSPEVQLVLEAIGIEPGITRW